MVNRHISISFCFLFFMSTVTAQVGIGTPMPNSSSVLDIASTSKGLLPPRMTKANRNSIATPPAGLTVWCTNCGDFGEMQVFNGIDWTNMTGGAPAGLEDLDLFGGGTVVYILRPSDSGYVRGQVHGLVAALSNLAEVQWGCHSGPIIGTSVALGRGYNNTQRITLGCSTFVIAARVCDNLITNGFSDWHLPSKDELNKVYEDAFYLNMLTGTYWSSSEISFSIAWNQNFANGFQNGASKLGEWFVRPVRWF